MRRINLLPDHMKQARVRHRRRLRTNLALALAAMLALGWGGLAVMQVQAVNGRVADAEQALTPLREGGEQIRQLRAERERLHRELTMVKTLREPLPPASLLALLSQLAPEEAVLRKLMIELPQPTLATDAEGGDGAKAKDRREAAVRIELSGMAREDAAVAAMVSRLSEGGIFRDIRLSDSRETVFREQPGHTFRITMSVPLTRSTATAHADRTGDQ